MISEATPTADRAYVWVWLPGAVAPVVAGLLQRDRHGGYGFTYGREPVKPRGTARMICWTRRSA
ncbi:MAG: hypothetical protein KA142_00225 [Chromatiaceae bacterium]|nr:hypothetical protein [Chromatiaceae bacterium]MBP9603138.1 hypothetical protein [Chromatiaceae bacterium]